MTQAPAENVVTGCETFLLLAAARADEKLVNLSPGKVKRGNRIRVACF